MKMIHEMRRQQAWEAHKSASPLPIILGAVIAFGIGLLGVTGFVRTPALLQTKTQMVPVAPREAGKSATVTVDTSAHRTGSAEAAPLLKVCGPFSSLGIGNQVEPGELYRVMRSASGMSRVAALAGIKQGAIDDARFATIWADIADCVYRQNGWMLCDPDNRALAVDAATTFLRQLAAAEKAETFFYSGNARPPGLNEGQRAYALQRAGAVKGRVLSGMRAQVSDGRLTSSDFGMFAPSEIAELVRETKVTRDACAAGN